MLAEFEGTSTLSEALFLFLIRLVHAWNVALICCCVGLSMASSLAVIYTWLFCVILVLTRTLDLDFVSFLFYMHICLFVLEWSLPLYLCTGIVMMPEFQ